MMFKDDFKGTGNMRSFCDEANKLFAAMNNIDIVMPPEYSGPEPTLEFREGRLVFDFGSALIFTTENIDWDLTGDAGISFDTYTADVVDGQLEITVEASYLPPPP